MKRIGHIRQRVKCHVRMIPADSDEGREIEKDYRIPEKGFCHECEAIVDEAAGKLHRPTCKTEPSRRRTA